MTALSDFSARAAGMLRDPQGLIYDAAALESALRTALAEYSRATGIPETIQGLDGAAVTTIRRLDEVVIAMGTAGHAACSRGLQRAESFNLGQQVPAELTAWGQAALECFRGLLDLIHLASLHGAEAAPWAEGGWPLDTWDQPV